MDVVYFLLTGAIAGWLAGLVMKGGGFGLVGNIVVGILGGVLGGWLFPLAGLAARSESHSARNSTAHAASFVAGSRRIHRFACDPAPRFRRDQHRPARKHFHHGLLQIGGALGPIVTAAGGAIVLLFVVGLLKKGS